MDLKFKLLTPTAKLPQRGSPRAAGLDLFADQAANVLPNERVLIKTGIAVQLCSGTYMRIAPRSGLAYKFGINILAGVIDSDYRGEIGVILFNHSREFFRVDVGDRIAQGIVTPIILPEPIAIHFGDDLDGTERGSDGFGSTGIS